MSEPEDEEPMMEEEEPEVEEGEEELEGEEGEEGEEELEGEEGEEGEEPEDEGDAPGDLEAPLLGESRSEDDVQEEETTAMSQAMSSAIGHDLTPSQTRFLVTGSFIDILTNVSVSFIFPFLNLHMLNT